MGATTLKPEILIAGIPFIVTDMTNGDVALDHAKYGSLCVCSQSTQGAIESMMGLLIDVAHEYIHADEATLSEDAKEFKRYLIQRMSGQFQDTP